MMKFILSLLILAQSSFAGLPPTTSKLSSDSNNVTTFNYLFPFFAGTHTGTSVSLGVLSPAGGGSGTGTAFTAGSVLFAGAAGVYSQDNANFFFDDTNNRLSIGKTAPSVTLDVLGVMNETNSGLNATSTDGLLITNTTAATSGQGQNSPRLRLHGAWWDTSTGSSKDLDVKAEINGISTSTTNVLPVFNISLSEAAGAYTNILSVDHVARATMKSLALTGLGATSGAALTTTDGAAIISRLGLGNSSTDGIVLQNTTAATVGTTVQYTPRLHFIGKAWTGSASQDVDWIMEAIPVNGTNPVTSSFGIKGSANGNAYVTGLSMTGAGVVSFPQYGTGIIHSSSVGLLTSSAVALGGADVSGTLPIANGGTGQTAKAAAFDALSPMSASGDIIYGGTSGTGTRLAAGSNSQKLTLVAGVPAWASGSSNNAVRAVTTTDTITTADDTITFSSSGGAYTITLPTASGNTGKIFYFKKTDSSTNIVTIDANGSETIDGALNVQSASIYDELAIQSNGTNWVTLNYAINNASIANVATGVVFDGTVWLAYTNVIEDNLNQLVAGAFTAKVAGLYQVNFSGSSQARAIAVALRKNGTKIVVATSSPAANTVSSGSTLVRLAVGDVLDVTNEAGGSELTTANATYNVFSVKRVGN